MDEAMGAMILGNPGYLRGVVMLANCASRVRVGVKRLCVGRRLAANCQKYSVGHRHCPALRMMYQGRGALRRSVLRE